MWDNLLIYGRYFDLPRPLIQRARRGAARLRAARRPARLEGRSAVGRHEAPAHDRPRAHQPARAAAARRADDRPRPAGAAPRVGAPVPAQADRASTLVLTTHYMDEAEQLCDRLVIMDRGRIVAEGSPRDLIAEHVTREVVEVRFEADADADDRAREARSRSPIASSRSPTASCSTPTTATASPRRSTSTACARGVGARAPGQPRRRVPDPHRPHAGRG